MPGKTRFRFMTIAILAALAVALAAALPGVSADGGEDKNREQGQAPPIPDKTALNYPNLGSHLDELVTRVEAGQTTSKDAAGDTPVYSGESVAVTIYVTGNVDDVVSFLEDKGGDPRNVGEDYIEAYVPVTLLGPVSEQSGVIRVREIVPPLPAQGVQGVAGHGPAAHLSAAWNQAGYTGQGVKVGIIDIGFEGFSGLRGTELPTTVQARCYTDIGKFTTNLADCENGDEHGTIVAESVIDISPEVSLYIANAGTKGDLQSAADWMIAEGVSVINTSLSFTFDGPGDGTSPFSDSPLKAVDRAVAGGVVWVTSAGNDAQKAWFSRSPFIDQDRAGLMEFAAGDLLNNMTLQAGDRISVQLRWDGSWEGAGMNLDLGIWSIDAELFASLSIDPQSGGTGQVPSEFLVYEVPFDGEYAVAVWHVSGGEPGWIQLIVKRVPYIEHRTGNGSITNPGESANPGMLAVGAARWNDVRAISPISSRGPTPPDGRVKPDIVGAHCGATALRPLNESNAGFCGTSQAAPHVAGLAALVRQRFPDYTSAQVASYLKDFAEQREGPDPNNTWGHGFAILPPPAGEAQPTPPTLSTAYTRNPAADFSGLRSAGNTGPQGIWSDGTTMWVADITDDKIYAYDLATGARVPGNDFDTLKAIGDTWPRGIWSDGTTMWVVGFFDGKIYAYDLATKARVSGKDFDTLITAANFAPLGIWSDGVTMWVADFQDVKIYAYDLATKARVPGKDFDTLIAADNTRPTGIWSDGTTMWVADRGQEKIFAYDLATKARVPGKDFNTLITAANFAPRGIWSDGRTMWASDWEHQKIFAYRMPQLPSPDREALIAFYNSTSGANWTEHTYWLTNAPVGHWQGVTTDSQGRVTELNLTSNRLKGEIPPELANLTNLKVLALGGNELTGPIPTWLGGLTNLEELYLWENELTGTIPAELGSLVNLKELWLSNNQLSGEIPVELGSPSNLVQLVLWGNELTGEIPAELGSLSNLELLSLSANELTGEIPAELGSLSNLELLSLSANELTGEIPAELGSLSNLQELWLSGNQLTGEIPVELGSLSNLVQLVLLVNELTGTIPAELGSLTNLEGLYLRGNQLTGEIPPELGSLANLKELWLSQNQLTGEIPVELGSLANLEGLYLHSNQLTGEIPAELGSLANLVELYLWGNQLTGMVPQTLVGLTMLERFIFYKNPGLCAPIDDAFQTWLGSISTYVLGSSCAPADSPEDRAVLVQVHSATGGANWTNSDNWLSEEHLIREWYGVTNDANGRVNGLLLDDNQLTGKIPSELGSLANLEWLLLYNNQLTETIPAELGRLTNLTVLSIAGNQLTGCVPASLQDVANNDFAQLGLPFCHSYDANGDGAIDIGELFSAIDDYFDGRIDISELFAIIDLYFSGPTPTATAQPPGAPTGLTATANGPENREWPGVRPGNHAEHSAP